MDLSGFTREKKLELLALLNEQSDRARYRKINLIFPDTGPLRRELYPKHCEFFRAGAFKKERLFMAGNQVGKTEAGGCELTYHLTGNYPGSWEGKRFDRPIRALAAGDTSQTTRDIIQKKLLGGEYGTADWGSGLVPRHLIGKPTPKPGVPKAYEEVKVLHEPTGKWSTLKLRSYDQGRRIFQGTQEDFVWMDEECPYDVYEEALVRLFTTDGIFILTFTPLSGLTELVKSFMDSCKDQDIESSDEPRYLVQAGWDHAPHLTEEKKDKLGKTLGLKPHQLKARKYGIPSLGAGAIYPYDVEDIKVKPFRIPKEWPRAYGLDVGWRRTAAIWGAWDRESDIVYLYSEHYIGGASPVEHSAAIKRRGEWIQGTIDPASQASSQKDGECLIDHYIGHGLKLIPADNSVDTGIYAVQERLATGRLKVFGSLTNWIYEFGLYRRVEKQTETGTIIKIVKEDDHLMDATRYLIMMLELIMSQMPIKGARIKTPTGDWRTG